MRACPHPVFDQLRNRCPVARAALIGSPVISRYEDVIWALRHPEIFSSEMDPKMMGLPLDDLDLFLELKDGIIRPQTKADDIEGQTKIRTETSDRIFAYFSEVIDDRLRTPRDDMLTNLVNTRIDGETVRTKRTNRVP